MELCELGRQRGGFCLKVYGIRGAIVERRMRPHRVVKADVAPDAGFGRRRAIVCTKVDFFVLERTPEALDEDIIAPATDG